MMIQDDENNRNHLLHDVFKSGKEMSPVFVWAFGK